MTTTVRRSRLLITKNSRSKYLDMIRQRYKLLTRKLETVKINEFTYESRKF